MTQDSILIFCDGACSGNPGPGGWGSILVFPSGEVRELGGHESNTTNNQMELSATIEALKSISAKTGKVKIYTDSTYVIQGITQWIWAWKQKDWKTAEGKEVSNRNLWEKLFDCVSKRGKDNGISWHYVRGHQGIPGNERVDEIAVAFSLKKTIELFSGNLKDYSHDIFQLPEDTSLPSSSSKSSQGKKAKAYSYLSLVNGKVERHKTWAECEARVKGVPSTKFKKATSEEDEKSILRSWGVKLV